MRACLDEVFWPLVVDGVPPARLVAPVPCKPCAFGRFLPPLDVSVLPRHHHFWVCPLTQPLRVVLEDGCGCAVTWAHVWLCNTPDKAWVLLLCVCGGGGCGVAGCPERPASHMRVLARVARVLVDAGLHHAGSTRVMH